MKMMVNCSSTSLFVKGFQTKYFYCRKMSSVKCNIECECARYSGCAVCPTAPVCHSITYPHRIVGTMIFLNIVFCAGFIIFGIFVGLQPFGYRYDEDVTNAIGLCAPPAALTLLEAGLAIRIYRQNKLRISVIIAAIVSFILCIYTAIVPAFSNDQNYMYYEKRKKTYMEVFVLSITCSVLTGLQCLIWLSVICVPTKFKLFNEGQLVTPPPSVINNNAENVNEDTTRLLETRSEND